MKSNVLALAEEVSEYISERKLLVVLIVVPAFMSGLIGSTVGGIIAGHATDRLVRDQIARAEATHARFDMADITLQAGPGRLGQMIVLPKSNETMITSVVCPPHITSQSVCFTVERVDPGDAE